jgi:hypothetical protein
MKRFPKVTAEMIEPARRVFRTIRSSGRLAIILLELYNGLLPGVKHGTIVQIREVIANEGAVALVAGRDDLVKDLDYAYETLSAVLRKLED